MFICEKRQATLLLHSEERITQKPLHCGGHKNNKGLKTMSLTLNNVSRVVDGETWIDNVNLSLEPGSFNVLLGRTLSGKTTLMRLMAGLDRPTHGQIMMNGVDVTGVPVRERNISMVYQQFINYPNMTVYDNIASRFAWQKCLTAK